MQAEHAKLVEATARTAEEIMADLPEWARKIVTAARATHKHIEGSTYRRADEQALLEAIETGHLEWWRR